MFNARPNRNYWESRKWENKNSLEANQLFHINSSWTNSRKPALVQIQILNLSRVQLRVSSKHHRISNDLLWLHYSYKILTILTPFPPISAVWFWYTEYNDVMKFPNLLEIDEFIIVIAELKNRSEWKIMSSATKRNSLPF